MSYEEFEMLIIKKMFATPIQSGDTITTYHKRIAGEVIKLFAIYFPNGYRSEEFKLTNITRKYL